MDEREREAYEAAIEAGERAHVLTVGSPVRGLALRVVMGRLDRDARWRAGWPDVFLIWRGIRYGNRELAGRMSEAFWLWLAHRLPKPLVRWALIRAGVHASNGPWSDQVVPDMSYFDVLERWDAPRIAPIDPELVHG